MCLFRTILRTEAINNFDHIENTQFGLNNKHDNCFRSILIEVLVDKNKYKIIINVMVVGHGRMISREGVNCQKVISSTTVPTSVKMTENLNVDNTLFQIDCNEYRYKKPACKYFPGLLEE